MTAQRVWYLGEEKHRKRRHYTIRSSIVVKGRASIEDLGLDISNFKRWFRIMKMCYYDDTLITKAEGIAILRRKPSTQQPTPEELEHFNSITEQFRRYLNGVSGVVVYAFKNEITQGKGQEYVFRPLKSKKEYMQIAGRHIKNVEQGLTVRHAQNLEALSKTKRQIEKLIEDTDRQISLEAEGLIRQHGRRRKVSAK